MMIELLEVDVGEEWVDNTKVVNFITTDILWILCIMYSRDFAMRSTIRVKESGVITSRGLVKSLLTWPNRCSNKGSLHLLIHLLNARRTRGAVIAKDCDLGWTGSAC